MQLNRNRSAKPLGPGPQSTPLRSIKPATAFLTPPGSDNSGRAKGPRWSQAVTPLFGPRSLRKCVECYPSRRGRGEPTRAERDSLTIRHHDQRAARTTPVPTLCGTLCGTKNELGSAIGSRDVIHESRRRYLSLLMHRRAQLRMPCHPPPQPTCGAGCTRSHGKLCAMPRPHCSTLSAAS